MPRYTKHGKRRNRQINFDRLLRDIKKEENIKNKPVERLKVVEEVIKPKEIEAVSMERRMRSSKLDNKLNLYIYSKNNMILHDRDCSYAKRISDKDFDMITEYSDKFKKCKRCNTRMILRKAIALDNQRYLNLLVNFMIKIGATEKELLDIFINNNGTLRLITLNKEIEIHVKEDTWRIILNDNKTLTLMHNNYEILEGGSRFFKDTFHIQKTNIDFKICALYMLSYSYEQHCENELKNKVNSMIYQHKDLYESLKYIAVNMKEKERMIAFEALNNIVKMHMTNNGED